ncbi:MAG: hypothetical protein ABI742_12190, partial [Gemmatimonadota bacterium]
TAPTDFSEVTHPHAPPDPSPHDRDFLRVFFGSVAALLALVAALVVLTDPLGRFGTGLVPPVVASDRDQKAVLYRARVPLPESVVLGSSRSKTIAPACLARLTGRPAFNFAVNGSGTEDLVAILGYLRAQPGSKLRTLFVGVDPEMLQGAGGVHRALEGSRFLAPYAPDGATAKPSGSLGADLFGWQAVSAALRSIWSRLVSGGGLPEFALEADGLQRYPRAEAALQLGALEQHGAVIGSIPGILGRYEAFPALDSVRVGYLRRFASEAHNAGIDLVAFIPPVHPAFERAASGTAWTPRTEETVSLLRTLEQEQLLRYVEARDLVAASPDTTQFVDAIHFLAPVAATLAERLTGSPGHCALQ